MEVAAATYPSSGTAAATAMDVEAAEAGPGAGARAEPQGSSAVEPGTDRPPPSGAVDAAGGDLGRADAGGGAAASTSSATASAGGAEGADSGGGQRPALEAEQTGDEVA